MFYRLWVPVSIQDHKTCDMSDTAFFHLGLIGWPLQHSVSPSLHSVFLRSAGIAGRYDLYPIPVKSNSDDQLIALLQRMRSGDLSGLNVTIPHKQAVISYLDALTPRAERIGAVNTIYLQDDQLTGDNTDAPGFLADLKRFLSDNEVISTDNEVISTDQAPPKAALVLGAGGSARAVVDALANAGWQVTIAARRLNQAQSLVGELAQSNHPLLSPLPLVPITLTPDSLIQHPPDLIINTTPVGMSPNTSVSPWPGEIPFPSRALLYDLVYNPQETLLVQRAQQAGLPATTGIGMLVEQAALAFQRWTGLPVPPEVKLTARKVAAEAL